MYDIYADQLGWCQGGQWGGIYASPMERLGRLTVTIFEVEDAYRAATTDAQGRLLDFMPPLGGPSPQGAQVPKSTN